MSKNMAEQSITALTFGYSCLKQFGSVDFILAREHQIINNSNSLDKQITHKKIIWETLKTADNTKSGS